MSDKTMADVKNLTGAQFEAFLELRYGYGIFIPTLRQINHYVLYGAAIHDVGEVLL